MLPLNGGNVNPSEPRTGRTGDGVDREDPAEPSKDVGTELLFENDRVRVWGMVLGPGESSPRHRHTADYLFVYTTPSRLTAFIEDRPPATNDYDDGFVAFTEVGGGTEHHIRNDGDTVHRQIIVELKGQSRAARPLSPQDNGRKR
jgi:beta-alanine degradation protein BauB